METKNYVITKLTGENYFTWKLKMKLVLQKEKLWNIVTKDPPTTTSDDWIIKDQSAMATIGLALEDKLLILITDCETSKQTWEKLKTTYEHANLTNKLFLLKKLYGSKYEAHKNMEEYINGIKELAERLRVIGESVKESHIIAVILCGLPQQFDSLVTAIESREEKEINMEYICAKLRDEAARKETQHEHELDHETAMTIRERTGTGLKKGRIICHLCGREGHIRRNCERNTSHTTYRNEGYGKRTDIYPTRNDNQSLISNEQDINEMVNLCEEWALSGTTGVDGRYMEPWVIDSGASAHMSGNKNLFVEIESLDNDQKKCVHMANGERVKVMGKGKIIINLIHNDVNYRLELLDVLFVPDIKLQLISVKKLCQSGLTVIFNNLECNIYHNKNIIATGKQEGNIYIIRDSTCPDELVASACCVHKWHERFGHRSVESIKRMDTMSLVHDLKMNKCQHDNFCSACQQGTMTQRHFSTSNNRADKPFKVLVTDLCGPICPMSMGGSKYILTCTDQFSGYVQIKLLKTKEEASESLINIIEQGNNHFKHYPEIVRSDGGGEYQSLRFKSYLTTRGIVHQTSVPHTPQQNGQSERMNRTLLNEMRSIIKAKNLPLELWGEIAVTAAYINNLVMSKFSSRTPYELWHKRIPSVGHLRVIGSIAYAFVPKCKRKKLDDTSIKGILVGYGVTQKCYRVWIPGTRKNN